MQNGQLLQELKLLNNDQLHSKTIELVKSERKLTLQILSCISLIESRRLYAEKGFGSTYEYLIKCCGYSPGSAYRRIQAARLLRDIPEVEKSLVEGKVNLSQLVQVQMGQKAASLIHSNSYTKSKDEMILHKKLIIEKVAGQTSLESQKIIAKEYDIPIQQESKQQIHRDGSVSLTIYLTSEQMKKYTEVKNILSHAVPSAQWSDLLEYLCDLVIKKHRIISMRDTTEAVVQRKITSDKILKTRTPISARQRKSILQKANFQCEYKDTISNHRCESKFQLEIDHIQPIALGGKNEIANLRVLCKTHNLLMAKRNGLIK